MGNVSARDRPYGDDDGLVAEEEPTVSLEGVAARVTRVQVLGLVRTKDDMIVDSIEPVLKVKDFSELVLAAQDARNRLHNLGCFKGVDVEIDTSEGGGSNDYEVTFAVEELRRIQGTVNTMVGNQEGSLLFGIKLPNLFGRGEGFHLNYTHGTKKSNQFDMSFMKPIKGSRVEPDLPPFVASVTGTVFQQSVESCPSRYKETARGGLIDLAFHSAPQVGHNFQAEVVWRHLTCLNSSSAFAIREHCGHTLKSALRHVLTVDRRDSPIFPTEGSLFKMTQEYAGLGGDVGFYKNEVQAQANLPLFAFRSVFPGPPCVLQTSFQCGHLRRLGRGMVTLSDRFYLGGPLNVRGFDMRGVGPSSEGCATGGMAYWATGLHLYTPMPVKRGGGFWDLFRTHSFVTAGNLLTSYSYDFSRGVEGNLDEAIRNFRLSYGVGIALKFGDIARVELNYCLPVRAQRGDMVTPGVQLGVGVNIL